jgi:hypothetical protein
MSPSIKSWADAVVIVHVLTEVLFVANVDDVKVI